MAFVYEAVLVSCFSCYVIQRIINNTGFSTFLLSATTKQKAQSFTRVRSLKY
jgi:hypothetical protein